VAGSPVIGRRRGAFSTLLRRPGLRASSDGVLATKSERKMLASTCSPSFITSDYVREQTKLVDVPLVVADRRHPVFGHTIRLPEETPARTVFQQVINVTKESHLAASWKRPQGRKQGQRSHDISAYRRASTPRRSTLSVEGPLRSVSTGRTQLPTRRR